MIIECYDEKGAEVYEMVVKSILQDVMVTRAIKDIRVFVDPREPVFIIIVRFETSAPLIVLEDFAEYTFDKEKNRVIIRIKDETYLPELLQRLWEVEGREKIFQPTRFEVIIENPQVEIKGMVVHDPTEDLKKKIYDAIFRIIPEGFRVIKHYSKGDVIAMTCSDDTIKDEWIEKCKKMLKEVK
jgi:putative methanogenesis marker protein 17